MTWEDFAWLFTVPVLKLSLKIAVTLCSLFLAVQVIRWRYQAQYKNPFLYKPRAQRKDVKKKKRRFEPDLVPEYPEAIIIGSGIGSLTTASLLSRGGFRRIVVLESHETEVGGSTHVYREPDYEFDVGIHYVGGFGSQTLLKTLIDKITDGALEWEPLDNPFDFVYISSRNHPVYETFSAWKTYLIETFPAEKDGIQKFFSEYLESKDIKRFGITQFLLKSLPLSLVSILLKFKIFTLLGFWNEKKYLSSTKSVVESLTSNVDLQKIMSYSWGDYGTPPSCSPWIMQSLLLRHFSQGGAYPVGGSSKIADTLIPAIEENDGVVFCNSPVSEILYDGKKVMGVKVLRGNKAFEIKAPIIISGAGIYNTFETLLPKSLAVKSYYYDILKSEFNCEHAIAMMSVYIGFDESCEDLELDKKNTWAYFSDSLDAVEKFVSMSLSDILDREENLVPLIFVSYPRAKDPMRDDEKELVKGTCTIIGPASWAWFSEWENTKVKKRGDEYESLKKNLGERFIDRFLEIRPDLKSHVRFVEVGSPLTNQHYLRQPKGEIYGLDHTINRFKQKTIARLRPKTDIPGLYLTGQDILTCGFAGAAFSGILTAAAVMERNVMSDLIKCHKTSKASSKKKSD